MRWTDKLAGALQGARDKLTGAQPGGVDDNRVMTERESMVYDRWLAHQEPRNAFERQMFAGFAEDDAAEERASAEYYEELAKQELREREHPEEAEADRQAELYQEAWAAHGQGDHYYCADAGIDDLANPDPRDNAPGDVVGEDLYTDHENMTGPGYTEPPAGWYVQMENDPEARYVRGDEPRGDEEAAQFAVWDADSRLAGFKANYEAGREPASEQEAEWHETYGRQDTPGRWDHQETDATRDGREFRIVHDPDVDLTTDIEHRSGPGYTEPDNDPRGWETVDPAITPDAEAHWESRGGAARDMQAQEAGSATGRPMTEEERAQADDIAQYVTQVMGSPEEAAEVLAGAQWYSTPAADPAVDPFNDASGHFIEPGSDREATS